MNLIKSLVAIFAIINTSLYACAFQYCEEDKNMFYDAFLDGYFTEMEKTVDKLNIEQEKKDKFIASLKQRTNKTDLINSSWNCIQSYPIEQIVAASVICTSDWTNKQAEENKDLLDLLK